MKRVLVIGSGGTGKTTVARRLAQRTGLPLIHLDLLYWRPGWQPTPGDEWQQTVGRLVAGEEWIIDGNYGGTLDLRLTACDTVVFLDLPRLLCLWRVLVRQLRYFGRERPKLPEGGSARLSLVSPVWIWTYPPRRLRALVDVVPGLGRAERVRLCV